MATDPNGLDASAVKRFQDVPPQESACAREEDLHACTYWTRRAGTAVTKRPPHSRT